MNIRKLLGCTIAAFACVTASFALTVDKAEIESVGSDAVVFKNYSGPHTVINTIAEIRAIGSGLGTSVQAAPEKSITAGSSNKYQVIHAIDPSVKDKLDADIFIIGKDATVDHITNVRRIIAAYLETAYGYSAKDAQTIATFVTVYNAVYRGNVKYFESKYKQVVTSNLVQEKTGISTDYQEWPGKTQMIIPLSDINGGLSTVDTSIISDRQVVKSMQEEDDKGVDARKDMVDLKEREADNASEKAQEAQKKATAENEKLKQEQQKSTQANKDASQAQKKADTAKKEADTAKKKADTAQKKAEANPNDKQAQSQATQAKKDAEAAEKKAETAQKEADTKQSEATEQNKKTEEQAQKAQEAAKEATEAQETADKKRTEAQDERTSIAKDQQTILRESSNNETTNVMFGLKNVDDLGATSEIVKLNAADGSLIKESPVTVIRGRTVYEDGNNFVAVAGTNFGNGTVKLVLIDRENLEIVGESKESLSELSVLAEKDGNYYATIQDGRDFYIGKFNNQAQLIVKSPVKVKAATPITITSKGVLINTANNNPAILKLDDLSLIGEGTSSNTNKAANIINGATSAANAINAK